MSFKDRKRRWRFNNDLTQIRSPFMRCSNPHDIREQNERIRKLELRKKRRREKLLLMKEIMKENRKLFKTKRRKTNG